MTQEQYLQFASEFFEACLQISKAKNSDYTGGGDDAFANFTSVESLHISTEAGFITRMNDKLMRIASFVKQGPLQVKDESVTDTLRDLANYCCLMAGYLKSKKQQGVSQAVPDQILSGGVCMCVAPLVLGDQVLVDEGKRLNFQREAENKYRVYLKPRPRFEYGVVQYNLSREEFDYHFTILKTADIYYHD